MSEDTRVWRHKSLLFINHVCDVFGLVDPTVVHHDDRTVPRELVHLVQEAANESFESLHIVGTFDSI